MIAVLMPVMILPGVVAVAVVVIFGIAEAVSIPAIVMVGSIVPASMGRWPK
jgi:hypothetical protein